MEHSFIKYSLIFLVLIQITNSDDFKDSRFSSPSENMFYSTVPACYRKIVGSKGTIESPVLSRPYQYPVDCVWDIVVNDNYNIEFEFKIFKLPKSGGHKCESYVELVYEKDQDGIIRRLFCPHYLLDTLYIESSTAHLRFHSGQYSAEYGNESYGFKINYVAIPVTPEANHAGTIVLVSFATLIIITVCIICIRSHRKSSRIGQIPSHVTAPPAPNAPTRADLQAAFDFHRSEYTQAPQNRSRYLSRTNQYIGDLENQRDINQPQNIDDRRVSEIFITTTPRSVYPISRGALGPDSARRMADLRTRLVARFSSMSSTDSSADRSVFFTPSSQLSYSNLAFEEGEEQVPEGKPQTERRSSASSSGRNIPSTSRENGQRRGSVSSGGKNVPSIVIEFFE